MGITKKNIRNRHDNYIHASDIAARLVQDQYGISIDRIICNPEYREEFDKIASDIIPNTPNYHLRKGALALRKRRKLRPELICRIADWDKEILTLKATEALDDKDRIPKKPGVYIFRDSTGVLYIGEASKLRIRVSKHLDHSDRKSLAPYFWQNGFGEIQIDIHAFSSDSDGKALRINKRYNFKVYGTMFR